MTSTLSAAPHRELFADGLAGAIDVLELGSPVQARDALETGLRSYIIGRVAG